MRSCRLARLRLRLDDGKLVYDEKGEKRPVEVLGGISDYRFFKTVQSQFSALGNLMS